MWEKKTFSAHGRQGNRLQLDLDEGLSYGFPMTAVTNWLNLNVFKQYSLLWFCSGGQKANNGSQWTKTKVWTELCASAGSKEESLSLVPPVSRGAHIPCSGPHPGIGSVLPLLLPSYTLSGSSLSLLRIMSWFCPPSWIIWDHLPSQIPSATEGLMFTIVGCATCSSLGRTLFCLPLWSLPFLLTDAHVNDVQG